MTDSTAKRQATCEERVDDQFARVMDTLRLPHSLGWPRHDEWADKDEHDREAWFQDECKLSVVVDWTEDDPPYVDLFEYGLSFDYVEPDTFNEQPNGYYRWQLSWGGPSDEVRYYTHPIEDVRRFGGTVEYAFMDWFDGATREVKGVDKDILLDVLDHMLECGVAG